MKKLILVLLPLLVACAGAEEKSSKTFPNIHALWASETSQWDLRDAGLGLVTKRFVPLDSGCKAWVKLQGDYLTGILIIDDLGDRCLSQNYEATYNVAGNQLVLCIQNGFVNACETFLPLE